MMRRLALTLVTALTFAAALAIFAAPAGADPANKNTLHITLDCGATGTLDAVFELSSSDSFHVVSMSSNFLWKTLAYVTPAGDSGVIDRGIKGGGHKDLVTCTYTGAVSRNNYTVTGFFTP
jgi:hypothetical protein